MRYVSWIAVIFACTCGGALERAADGMNTGALERYTRTLPLGGLSLERCEMYGATRSGYCVLEGSSASVATFVGALPLTPAEPGAAYRDDCRSIAAFGAPEPGAANAHVLRPGGARHTPSGPLPPTDQNVHLRAVTIDPSGTKVCLDYEFPYG